MVGSVSLEQLHCSTGAMISSKISSRQDSFSAAEPLVGQSLRLQVLGRRDSFTFVCYAPGRKNRSGILQLFFLSF